MTKKKSTKIKPTPSPDAYLKFIQGAALQGIGLDKANINIDRHALAEAQTGGAQLNLTLNASFHVILRASDRMVVGADFQIRQSKPGELANDKGLLEVDCSFSGLFQLNVSCDHDTAERFANAEAKLIFWPYFRHFVADITYRMSITPILIPLMTTSPVTSTESK